MCQCSLSPTVVGIVTYGFWGGLVRQVVVFCLVLCLRMLDWCLLFMFVSAHVCMTMDGFDSLRSSSGR